MDLDEFKATCLEMVREGWVFAALKGGVWVRDAPAKMPRDGSGRCPINAAYCYKEETVPYGCRADYLGAQLGLERERISDIVCAADMAVNYTRNPRMATDTNTMMMSEFFMELEQISELPKEAKVRAIGKHEDFIKGPKVEP